MSNRRLHIPQGTEAFYLEEALAHRAVLRTFEDQCALWGYMPVQTPVLDYHEPYRGVMAEEADASSYRLVDREGHLLSLRSDMTLFLARQMGMKLEPGDLPVRVYYGDTIIRHETTHHLSKDEYFQIGAELIGEPGIDADEEVVLMLLDLLEKLGAASVVVHIGQRALATAVAGTTTSDETVARLVAERAWHRLADELAACGVPAARSEQLLRLFQFIGGTDALQELSASLDGLEQAEKAAFGFDSESRGIGGGDKKLPGCVAVVVVGFVNLTGVEGHQVGFVRFDPELLDQFERLRRQTVIIHARDECAIEIRVAFGVARRERKRAVVDGGGMRQVALFGD